MTERKSYEILSMEALNTARWLGLPRYFKHNASGGSYWATKVVYREADMVQCVSYTPHGWPGTIFIRPLDEFLTKFIAE